MRRDFGDEEASTSSIGLPSSRSISTRGSKRSFPVIRSSMTRPACTPAPPPVPAPPPPPPPPPPTIESMLKPIFGFEGTGTIGVGASGIIVRLSYASPKNSPLWQRPNENYFLAACPKWIVEIRSAASLRFETHVIEPRPRLVNTRETETER